MPIEQNDPHKYYVTEEAEKYFNNEENFERKAAQLLEEYQIKRELDNQKKLAISIDIC